MESNIKADKIRAECDNSDTDYPGLYEISVWLSKSKTFIYYWFEAGTKEIARAEAERQAEIDLRDDNSKYPPQPVWARSWSKLQPFMFNDGGVMKQEYRHGDFQLNWQDRTCRRFAKSPWHYCRRLTKYAA